MKKLNIWALTRWQSPDCSGLRCLGCKTAYGITGTDESLTRNIARIIRSFPGSQQGFVASCQHPERPAVRGLAATIAASCLPSGDRHQTTVEPSGADPPRGVDCGDVVLRLFFLPPMQLLR